jgi:hypothetical protein
MPSTAVGEGDEPGCDGDGDAPGADGDAEGDAPGADGEAVGEGAALADDVTAGAPDWTEGEGDVVGDPAGDGDPPGATLGETLGETLGDAVSAIGDGLVVCPLAGPTATGRGWAANTAAPSATSPRTARIGTRPIRLPRGKRSRQFGQKPETGVVT